MPTLIETIVSYTTDVVGFYVHAIFTANVKYIDIYIANSSSELHKITKLWQRVHGYLLTRQTSRKFKHSNLVLLMQLKHNNVQCI